MLGLIGDMIGLGIGNMWQDERQEDAQQFNSGEAKLTRDWSEHMRGTAYQATTADMMAAGLNPMLAYKNGASMPPGGASASSGIAGSGGGTNFAASLQSASQTELNEATAERARAEADEIRARTPTHAVNMDKMQQEIRESVERIEKIRQDVVTGQYSAANIAQQTINLKEAVPQIRATIEQLKTLAKLNEAQAYNQLVQGQHEGEKITLTRENVRDMQQRINENLPRLEATLKRLEEQSRLYGMPKQSNDAKAHDSALGQIGSILRSFLPIGKN